MGLEVIALRFNLSLDEGGVKCDNPDGMLEPLRKDALDCQSQSRTRNAKFERNKINCQRQTVAADLEIGAKTKTN